jgi:hypothetical protein
MMNSGKYYVGDLCYVMGPEWDEVCSLMFAGRTDHGCNQGEFNLADGRRFVVFNTAYGDGVYKDQVGRRYYVDAGCIGAIKVDDISVGNDDVDGGNVVVFDKPFHPHSDNGILHFGHVVIDTANDSWDDEDEDEEECDE